MAPLEFGLLNKSNQGYTINIANSTPSVGSQIGGQFAMLGMSLLGSVFAQAINGGANSGAAQGGAQQQPVAMSRAQVSALKTHEEAELKKITAKRDELIKESSVTKADVDAAQGKVKDDTSMNGNADLQKYISAKSDFEKAKQDYSSMNTEFESAKSTFTANLTVITGTEEKVLGNITIPAPTEKGGENYYATELEGHRQDYVGNVPPPIAKDASQEEQSTYSKKLNEYNAKKSSFDIKMNEMKSKDDARDAAIAQNKTLADAWGPACSGTGGTKGPKLKDLKDKVAKGIVNDKGVAFAEADGYEQTISNHQKLVDDANDKQRLWDNIKTTKTGSSESSAPNEVVDESKKSAIDAKIKTLNALMESTKEIISKLNEVNTNYDLISSSSAKESTLNKIDGTGVSRTWNKLFNKKTYTTQKQNKALKNVQTEQMQLAYSKINALTVEIARMQADRDANFLNVH